MKNYLCGLMMAIVAMAQPPVQRAGVAVVTYGATITLDGTRGTVFTMTFGAGNVGACIIRNFSLGTRVILRLTQDGVGNRSILCAGATGIDTLVTIPVASGKTSVQEFYATSATTLSSVSSSVCIDCVPPSIKIPGATSGFTTVQPSAIASGTMTIPAGTTYTVNSADCSGVGAVQKINTDGTITCAAVSGTGHEFVPLRLSTCGGSLLAVVAGGGTGGCQGTGSFAELVFGTAGVRISFRVPAHWTGGAPTLYTGMTEPFGDPGTVTITAALATLANGSDLSAPSYNATGSTVITLDANIQVVKDGTIAALDTTGLVVGQMAEIKITGVAGTYPRTFSRLYDSGLDFPTN